MILLMNKHPPKKQWRAIDIFPIVGPLRVCENRSSNRKKSCHLRKEIQPMVIWYEGPLEKGDSYLEIIIFRLLPYISTSRNIREP